VRCDTSLSIFAYSIVSNRSQIVRKSVRETVRGQI
jgi:hypothetical protein